MVLILIFVSDSSLVCADSRTALVIGNSSYKSAPLQNPVNDASDISSVLRKLGFDVILKKNASKKVMLDAFRQFGRKLAASEIGIFYFAGHGMQINGINYLIPVNNNIQEESEVEFEAIDAGRILNKMENAGNALNIVILDACRNNPFKRSFRTSKKGFAQMDAPLGTVIAYATSPGSVAADGDGRNGTYTESLLKNLQISNLDVQKMFNRIGLDVMKKTNKKQVPWVSTTPFPDYYLAMGKQPVPKVKPVRPQPVAPSFSAPDKGDTYTDPITGMEFVWIEGGCYQMGSNSGDPDEKPVHRVCLDGFWMAKYEVTNEQYRQFKPNHNSATYKGVNFNRAKQPVVYVSWNDAEKFIKWLNRKTGQQFSLPTEAQWEYACRAGTSTQCYWGDNENDACKYANVYDITSKSKFSFKWSHHNCTDGYAGTAPGGSFSPNNFGLYDMHGNVSEWCEDVYDEKAYSKHVVNNPLRTSGSKYCVIRGGSWNIRRRYVRAANRNWYTSDFTNLSLGFRLCLPQVRQ